MRQGIDHHIRWPTAWLLLGLTWGWMSSPRQAWGTVQPDVQVSGASAFLNLPGQRWLKQMLRNRGFGICQGEPTPCGPKTLQVQLSSSGHIQIRNDTAQRLFRVPPHYKEAQLKARAVVTFVSLFVEMTSAQLPAPGFQPPPLPRMPKPMPSPEKGTSPKETQPLLRNQSTPTQKVGSWRKGRSSPAQQGSTKKNTARRRAKSSAPLSRRQVPRKNTPIPDAPRRTQPTPPKKRPTDRSVAAVLPVAPPTPLATSPKTTAPAKQSTPNPLRRPPSKKPLKPPKPPKPASTKRLASADLQSTLTPPKPSITRSGWLGLGLDGMIGLQDVSGIPFGGGLSLSGGGRIWALRLAIHAQPLLGLPTTTNGLLGRSDLLVGLAPLRGQFELWLEAGPSIELLWVRASDQETWQYRFGGLLGLRLAWAVHPRIKLYARPAALLFSQAYQFEQRGKLVFAASIWRIELALGIELRLW